LERWRPRDFWRRPDYAELGPFEIARQRVAEAPTGGWPEKPRLRIRFSGVVLDSLRAPDVPYSRGFEITSGLITERGAYLGPESFWIPWSGDERFVFRLHTELPNDWQSMSQGTRVEHVPARNGPNVSVWKETHPQEGAYLIAGPYVIREQQHKGVALYTYTYANTEPELCQSYLDAAGRYLELYGEMFGPYPFEKWALVENWWQTGFGMPSFTLLGDRVIRLPFIVDTSYGHEILHCWWGNGVYVDYEAGNWCEGLTAYGADYLYKERESERAARDYRRAQLSGYLDYASSGQRDFALREFRERSDFGSQAIGYGKSMMVFHMLRRRLGDETFLEGLRTLYADWRFQVAGWGEVRRSFERVSGEDLGPWFEQWIDRPGALQLSLGDVQRAEKGWRVELRQQEPLYRVQVELQWSDGESSQVERVELGGQRTWVELPPDATTVAVDPDYHLFRRLHREEIPPTFSQVLGADSTLVVIGEDTSPPLRRAYLEVAQAWSKNQDMLVAEERELGSAPTGGRSLLLLGPGSLADRALRAADAFGDQPSTLVEGAQARGESLVLCVRDPEDSSVAWVLLLAAEAETAEAIGRKLPHYGRYSYLVFSGEDNVDKGAWTVQSSPLRHRFSEDGS
jgi:hypothetical protein